ncbi:MAG: xanthine dehydrogenase family protein molybdopterin-binding subunit, partial [Terriglobales bacterium]
MRSSEEVKTTWTGQPLRRKEEDRLVRGNGKFIDDYKLEGMLYMRLVRSPYAHARINSVSVAAAESYPGAVCTLTGEEVAKLTQPFPEIAGGPGAKIKDYPLAVSKVRFQGEPVAAVIAESRMAAEDAADLVQVDYEALEPVVTCDDALTDASILHEEAGTNLVWSGQFEYGEVDKAFAEAASIVTIDRMH